MNAVKTVPLPADWTQQEKKLWNTIRQRIVAWKQEGKTVVFVTGVFDLFHQEHQNFLQKARAAGDVLVVGVESDTRVRETKGEYRPIHAQAQRRDTIAAFPAVDSVAILPEQFSRPEHHRAIIALLQPDILAVSSHSPYQEKKRAILEAFGGTLQVVHDHNPEVSTTRMLSDRTSE